MAPIPYRKTDPYPFYGMPQTTVDPKQFIELPDFTEIAREILPGVRFSASNRVPVMQVFSPAQYGFFKGYPLVLLDGIPIRDLNVIKNMNSKEIGRVEIIEAERYFGYLAFPGVVAIYTRKPDFARLNPSDELIKMNLETLQPDVSLNSNLKQKSNDLDFRKVLLWRPSVKPERNIKIEFVTSDIKGKYRLLINGIGQDGSVISNDQIFEVN